MLGKEESTAKTDLHWRCGGVMLVAVSIVVVFIVGFLPMRPHDLCDWAGVAIGPAAGVSVAVAEVMDTGRAARPARQPEERRPILVVLCPLPKSSFLSIRF